MGEAGRGVPGDPAQRRLSRRVPEVGEEEQGRVPAAAARRASAARGDLPLPAADQVQQGQDVVPGQADPGNVHRPGLGPAAVQRQEGGAGHPRGSPGGAGDGGARPQRGVQVQPARGGVHLRARPVPEAHPLPRPGPLRDHGEGLLPLLREAGGGPAARARGPPAGRRARPRVRAGAAQPHHHPRAVTRP